MKTHIQRTDASVLLSHAYPGQMEQIEAPAGNVARGKAQLQLSSDDAVRIARVELLKAQVNAGTYIVDSQAVAQKMLHSHNRKHVFGWFIASTSTCSYSQ
jgi:flagellar biosynthesis anti-sigma factor FlgM